jgi:hypothetical protein
MRSNNVYEGQWVRFKNGRKEYTGFVFKRNAEDARVAVPALRKTLTVPYVLMEDFETIKFTFNQIDAMIDVALDARDFDWVRELSEMKGALKQWK